MIRKRYSRKEIRIAISCTLIVIFILSFYIWHQTESISIGYMTSDLEDEVAYLKKEIKKLETVKSSLLCLERVERIARQELRLQTPEEQQIIFDNLDKRCP
jgi:cell division protein FtsL